MKQLMNHFWQNKKYEKYVFNNSEVHAVIADKVENIDSTEELRQEEVLKSSVDNILAIVPYKATELKNMLVASLSQSSQKNWSNYEQGFQKLIEDKFIKNLSESEQASIKIDNTDYKTVHTENFKYREVQNANVKNEIESKLKAVGLDGVDENSVQQAMIDAGYATADDDMMLDGKIGQKTMDALDEYHADMKESVENQKRFNKNVEKIESATIETFKTTELSFDMKGEMYNDNVLRPDASTLDLQNSSRSYQEDSILFQKELQFFDTQFAELSGTEIESEKEEVSTGDKFWDFGKSLLKTANFVPGLIYSQLSGPSDELVKAKEKKYALLDKIEESKNALEPKKNKLDENKTVLQNGGNDLLTRERSRKLAYEDQQKYEANKIENSEKRNNHRQDALSQKQGALTGFSAKLNNQMLSFDTQFPAVQSSVDNVDNQHNKITVTISQLEKTLENLPKFSPQTKKIQQVIQTLQATQDGLDGKKLSYEAARKNLLQQQDNAEDNLNVLNDEFNELDLANVSLHLANDSLEVLRLQNGTKSERILANFDQNIDSMTSLDGQIDIKADNLSNYNDFAFDSFENLGSEIFNFEPSEPSYWEQSVGGVMAGLGEGLTVLTDEVLTKPSKWLSEGGQWLEKTEIPVISEFGTTIDFIGDTGTGILEGASEIVKGITTMIGKPVETLTGMGALIGRDPQSGEFDWGTAGNTWKMFGQAMVGMDEHGEWPAGEDAGLAVGKAIANIGSFFIPGSGAGMAAKTAYMGKAGWAGKVGRVAAMPVAAGKAVLQNAIKTGPKTVGAIIKSPITLGKSIVKFPGKMLKKRFNSFQYYKGPKGIITKLDDQIASISKKGDYNNKFLNPNGTGYRVKPKYGRAKYAFDDGAKIEEFLVSDIKTRKIKPNYEKMKTSKLTSAEQKVLLEEIMGRQKLSKLKASRDNLQGKYESSFKSKRNAKKALNDLKDLQEKLIDDDLLSVNNKNNASIVDKVLSPLKNSNGKVEIKSVFTENGNLTLPAKRLIVDKLIKKKSFKTTIKPVTKSAINKFIKNLSEDKLKNVTTKLEANLGKYKQAKSKLDLFKKYGNEIKIVENNINKNVKSKLVYSNVSPNLIFNIKTGKIDVSMSLKKIDGSFAKNPVQALRDLKKIEVSTLTSAQSKAFAALKNKVLSDISIVDPLLSKIPSKAMIKSWKTAQGEFISELTKKPGKAFNKARKKLTGVWEEMSLLSKNKAWGYQMAESLTYGLPLRLAEKIVTAIRSNKVAYDWVKIDAILTANLMDDQKVIVYKNAFAAVEKTYQKNIEVV